MRLSISLQKLNQLLIHMLFIEQQIIESSMGRLREEA